MTNYLKEWREGYLEDEPFSRYEKLRSTRHHMTNDKAQTIARDKARRERLWAVGDWKHLKAPSCDKTLRSPPACQGS